MTFIQELGVWKRLGNLLVPVLTTLLFLNIAESFFWTIGPLLSEQLRAIHPFGGLFLSLYYLPPLVVGWVVGQVAQKSGKKHTAVVSILFASIALSLFFFISDAFILLFLVLVVAFCLSFAFPAIRATVADYISETPRLEPELEGISDFSANAGYIIGPIMAGILADATNNMQAFGILGFIGIVVTLILLPYSEKHIHVPRKI